MNGFGWRVLSVVGAFFSALVLPAVALVVITGLLRTGPAGLIAFSAWTTALVLLIRIMLRRRG